MESKEGTPRAQTLTARQRAFVEHYLATLNAAAAARAAGYSARSARQIGSRLLTDDDIRAALEGRLAEAAMSANEVLFRLTQHARGDIGEFIEPHIYGRPVVVLAEPELVDGEAVLKPNTHLIRKLTVTHDEVGLEMYDAQAALVQLGKYHKLWVERHDVTSNGETLAKAYIGVDVDEV